jgi:hypothetical protein
MAMCFMAPIQALASPQQGYPVIWTIHDFALRRMRQSNPMNPHTDLAKSTQWLRPVIRWATRFSLAAPKWLPDAVRFAPLRSASFVLRLYHQGLR